MIYRSKAGSGRLSIGFNSLGKASLMMGAAFVLGFSSLFPSLAEADSATFNARWWSAASFWNTPIGTTPAALEQAPVEPFSNAAINAYVSLSKGMNMNWDSAGVAVVYSDGVSDPVADITFANYPNWVWTFPRVPQSSALIAAVKYRTDQGNSDGMTCLYDEQLKGFYSFWQPVVNPNGKAISITTGAFNGNAGMGASSVDQFTPSGGRAIGTNYCGGLIRPQEIQAGVINHALALDWPSNLNLSAVAAKKVGIPVRTFPATNSDGTSVGTDGVIPMGSRLQLDPMLTDNQLIALGLTKPADLIIAHALQIYGAYDVDSNAPNANAGLYFQSGYGKGASIYQATNPWPVAVVAHMRVVVGPTPSALDTAASVKLPVRVK